MTTAQFAELMTVLRSIGEQLEKLANPLIVVKPAEITVVQAEVPTP